jgi:hypothetical protein
VKVADDEELDAVVAIDALFGQPVKPFGTLTAVMLTRDSMNVHDQRNPRETAEAFELNLKTVREASIIVLPLCSTHNKLPSCGRTFPNGATIDKLWSRVSI